MSAYVAPKWRAVAHSVVDLAAAYALNAKSIRLVWGKLWYRGLVGELADREQHVLAVLERWSGTSDWAAEVAAAKAGEWLGSEAHE